MVASGVDSRKVQTEENKDPMDKRIARIACVCLLLSLVPTFTQGGEEASASLPRFKAQEAHQGVAVDEKHVYAIASRAIGKYDKNTGALLKRWEASDEEPLIHLDSGVVVDDKLYCAHSNFPGLPMTSSVEIWDCETLRHVDSHSFGIAWGSCTWIDRYDEHWWAVFAHYQDGQKGGHPGRDNSWTVLLKFDDTWRPLESWVFPPEIVKRFERHSCSGGSWRADGLLYCTGHDAAEVYAMRLPKAGSILESVAILPFENHGQGIAFDRSGSRRLYGIVRKEKLVVSEILPSPKARRAE